MSRFEETLQRDLHVIADRATPSPDAWQQILTKAADQEPTQETEIIMLTDNTMPTRRWPLVAAAAALVAVAIGAIVVIGTGGDDTEQPADEPTPTIAPESSPVRELPAVGSVLEPGRYTSDTPGVTVTLTLGEGQTAPWTLASDQDAGIQLLADESDREFIGIGRVGSWFDADEARDENTTGLGSIAADDIDGWIEQNGIIVVDSAEVEVGGRSAEYRQFRLDTTPGATADFCPEGEQPCLWAVSGSADVIDENRQPVPVGRDRLHSIWLVDMAEYEPLFVIAIPDLADEATWFAETVQPIVDSIELGEPAPAVEGGTARLAAAETLALPVLVGSDVPAGRYSADMLGVPISFDVPDASPPWTQVFKTDVGFAVGSGTSTWIGAKRIGSFYGAEQAQDEDMTGLGSIPPDGVDTWIEANGMIVDQSSEVTVGGRAAQYRQVRIPADAGDCDEGFRPCISSVSSSADLQDVDPYPFVIHSERPWSFWIVDMGDFEPLWIAATTDQPDHQAWLDELAPMIESIELGEPAPAVEGGTALLPLRTDVSASYSGTRTVGPLLDDGTREVITEHTVEGDLVGELSAVGVQVTPSNGYDDLTFTGTIDGLGSGTLTMRQEWTASASGTITTTTVVTGGTGDFEGFTGRMITSVEAPDESGEVPIYTGRLTLQLVIPRSG